MYVVVYFIASPRETAFRERGMEWVVLSALFRQDPNRLCYVDQASTSQTPPPDS